MFDFNVKLGRWPYRPVRGLDALLRAMDASGVARAAVSSLSAVHFLNPQDGNEELAEIIVPYRDRFVFFAVLRPNFTGWEDDLGTCFDTFGARGIVLYPNYHEFDLADAALASMMHEAARRGAPVCVQAGLEGLRRQFRPYKVAEVSPAAIGDLARAYPDANVVALGLKFGQPEQAGAPLPANFYFDTSNYETMGELERAVEQFGADKLVLGSNYPLFNALANTDKLRCADLDDDARGAIGSANALRLLGM